MQGLAGLVIVVGATATWWQVHISRESQITERFTRAVIKADAAVPHGRVIHVLDLLKQAGVAKIAFGVTPVSPTLVPVPGPGPGTPSPTNK